ncbi:MFS transporter [Halostreptopolyspora alba]|uniref:MFS transporter n=1 Tax=Halostreptopolyspora alba TaxID=2487137 RepID=A0A3N0EFW7_9ACTN|nr:MFS transporter [Nocardiopsaceae bacterium YIM 96095]
MVLAMDLTVLHLAAPTLSADLSPSGTQLLWILDIYGFLIAGFLMTMGTLGDRVGRRRLLLVGAASFALASICAAYAPNAELLIAARALLGVAGATLMPSTLALLSTMFTDTAQRTFAISVWMTCFVVGEALGPLLGGLLLQFFWWGSVFLIGVPVMALLLVTGPLVLPEHRDRLSGRFDLLSAGLSMVAMLAIVYGVKQLAEAGPSTTALVWVLGGLLVGVVFLRRQRRLTEPLVDLGLFRIPAFSAALGTQTLSVCAMAGTQLLLMQYLQSVLGLSPLEAGLWLLPSILGGILGTMLAPKIVLRVRPGVVITASLLLAGAGASLVALAVGQDSLVWSIVGFTFLYTGVTPTLALTTDIIVGAAPSERAGLASAISESGAELGLAGGMAFLGSVSLAVYQTRLFDNAPAELSSEALRDAQHTIGGAVSEAERMGGETGTALLEAARLAFAEGLQVAAVLSAVVVVGAAVVSAVLLRGVPPNREGEDEAPSQESESTGPTSAADTVER